MPRFDIFIDEDKRNRKLGVLGVSNAVTLNQTLQSIKDRNRIGREVKWNGIDRFRLPVAMEWVQEAYMFPSFRFAIVDWPSHSSKVDVLADFLTRFLSDNDTSRLGGLFDSVAFLDFDNEDAKINLHLGLGRRAYLLRCYALDSKASNCLQLSDLLLGINTRLRLSDHADESKLMTRWEDVEYVLREHGRLSIPRFTESECKRYLAAYWRNRISGYEK